MDTNKITLDSFRTRLNLIKENFKANINTVKDGYIFISDSYEIEVRKDIDNICHKYTLELCVLFLELFQSGILKSESSKNTKLEEQRVLRQNFKNYTDYALDNLSSKS